MSPPPPPRSSRPIWARFILLTPAEEQNLSRYGLLAISGLLLLMLAFVPVARSGFFKEQVRLKQARALIEGGGYAWCALWGDHTDPFQLTSMGSPYRPHWEGSRQPDGKYLMTFSYRKKGQVYQHQWRVDLEEQRILPATPKTRVPLERKQNEFECGEQR